MFDVYICSRLVRRTVALFWSSPERGCVVAGGERSEEPPVVSKSLQPVRCGVTVTNAFQRCLLQYCYKSDHITLSSHVSLYSIFCFSAPPRYCLTTALWTLSSTLHLSGSVFLMSHLVLLLYRILKKHVRWLLKQICFKKFLRRRFYSISSCEGFSENLVWWGVRESNVFAIGLTV